MRIRRRPLQISSPTSSDLAAVGGVSGVAGAEESVTGDVAEKGEIIIGTGRLHSSMAALGKGWRSWGEDSISWRLGQPGEGRGSWSGAGSDASFYAESQEPHKGKAVEEDRVRPPSDDEKHQKPGAAQPAVRAHKTWNDTAAGGLHTTVAGLGAMTAAPVRINHTELASASGERTAWSSGSSRSVRSPPSSSSSIKTEISSGGGITSYMHGDDHQLVKNEDEKQQEEEQQLHVNDRRDKARNNSSGKRRRSPAVLMEGSRCSRVNGRGWRCCQQTLVGYSLCEHHLGKGRLRSVSSVRCKRTGKAAGKKLPSLPVNAVQKLHDEKRWILATSVDEEEEEEEEETKLDARVRVGKRIGIVKARSISSLLGQTTSHGVDHAGIIQKSVAPKRTPTATLSGLPSSLLRASVQSSAPAAVAAGSTSIPPPTAARQEVISAFV